MSRSNTSISNESAVNNAPDNKKKGAGFYLRGAGNDLGTAAARILKLSTSILKGTVKTALGPISLVAGTVAFFKTPAFVGIGGMLKSLAVGFGTTVLTGLGAVIGGFGGVLGGGLVGGLLGRLTGRREYAVIGAVMGATVGGLGGYIAGGVTGMFKGYDYSKEYMLKEFPKKFESGKTTAVFNTAAPKGKTVAFEVPVSAKAQKLQVIGN